MSYVDDLLAECYRLVDIDIWWQKMLFQDKEYDFCENTENIVENSVDNSEFDFRAVKENLPWGESYAADLISKKFENLLGYDADQNIWYLWNGVIHMPLKNSLAVKSIVKKFYRAYELAFQYTETMHMSQALIKAAEQGTKAGKDEADKLESKFNKEFKKQKMFRDGMNRPEGRARIITDLEVNLAVDSDKFYDESQWFVFRNGVIDCNAWRDGEYEILPHDPSRNVSSYFDADYDLEKDLGHWEKFIESTIEDEEVRKYVQACVGAAFLGERKIRTFLIFEGEPKSGKSVFLDVFGRLGNKGSKYSIGNANEDAIIQKKGGGNFNRANLHGKRFIGFSEPNAREELDGEFLKRFTGDPFFFAERKHKEQEEFVACGLMVLATNETPKMNSADTAIMNRAKFVKFPNTFVTHEPILSNERQAIPNLTELLLEDSASVLRWVVEGMMIHLEEYRDLDESSPSIMDEWSTDHKEHLQTPILWVQEMIESGKLEYLYDEEKISSVSNRQKLSTGHAHHHFEVWAEENKLRKFLLDNFIKLINDEYSIGGLPETLRSNGRRFNFLRPTKEFSNEIETLAKERSRKTKS